MAVEWHKLAFYDEMIPLPAGAAQGEVLYFGGVTWDKLAVGADGKQLTTHGAGADPTWEAGAGTFIGLPDTPVGFVLADAYYKVNAGTNAVEEGLVAGAASGLATLDAASLCAQDPKLHATSHESGGGDELDLSGMKADTLAEKTAGVGITADGVLLKDGEVTTDVINEKTAATGVTIDSCLIKDGKAADSNLLEAANKATVQDHAPKAHAASHKDGAADEILLHELGEPTAAVAIDGQQLTDYVIHTVADAAAMNALTPLVGKICWRTDELHPFVCTVAV